MGAVLITRGVIALLCGAWLGKATGVSWEGFFVMLAGYFIADGAIGAVLGTMLLRESVGRQRQREMALGLVVLVDAGGRALSGAAILLWPGIMGFAVTAVLFIAMMAASTAAVGLVEAWLTTREEIAQHGHDHQPPQFMAGPVGLAALMSLGFGAAAIAMIGDSDSTRLLISGFVAASGAVAIAMAWSRHRMQRRRLAVSSPPT